MNISKTTCPICDEYDQIQKVSAIITQQTKSISGTERRWNYDDGWQNVPFHGTEISELAKKLTPLPEPERNAKMNFGLISVNLFTGWGTAMLIWGSFFYGSIAIVSVGLGLVALFLGGIRVIFLTIIALGFATLPGGLLIWYWVRVPQIKKQAEITYKIEIDNWNKAMEKWNRLYYCYRDDQVFDINNGYTFSPDLMLNYLAKHNDQKDQS